MLTCFVIQPFDTAIRAGELDLGESSQQMSFTMLMEKSWQQEIINAGVV